MLSFIDETSANPTWLLSGVGEKYRRSRDIRLISELTPVELIRRGLEELERSTGEIVIASTGSLPGPEAADFVAIPLYSLPEIANQVLDPARSEGHVLAYRHWLASPTETVGVRLTDDAMNPILPAGSIVAVDRSVNDAVRLNGQIAAVRPGGHEPMIRWLEISGRHLILRPNQNGKDFPLIPIEYDGKSKNIIIGKVVWSWSRFASN